MPAPRETILRAASDLFAQRGFAETSLMDIARAVGISKAAIYHYFPTKQVIFDAIVVDLLQRLHDHVAAALPPASAGVAARLQSAMRGHAEFFEANYTEYVTLLHGFGGLNRIVSEQEREIRNRYEGLFRSIVAAGIDDGAMRVSSAPVVARGALSMLNWMTRWFDPKGERRAVDFAGDYFDMLAHGILRQNPTRSARGHVSSSRKST
jgi:AcrR family transcriptional regulator